MGKPRFDNVPGGVEQTRNSLQNYGLNREDKANVSSYVNTPPGRTVINTLDDKFLKTDGGKLHAPMAFDKITAVINGSNTIDIAQGGANFVPRIVLDGTTTSTLDTISNPLFEGQKIYIQAYSSGAITIGTAGNIQTAMSLSANHMMELIYDFDVGKWIMPEDNAGSGGSGEVFTWTDDHDAADNGLNNVSAIQISDTASSVHGLIQGLASTGVRLTLTSGEKYQIYDNITKLIELDGSDLTLSGIDLVFTGSSGITNPDFITMAGNIDMNTGTITDSGQIQINANSRLYFGSGGNYIYQNSSNGNLEYQTNSELVDHNFFVDSQLRLQIEEAEISMRVPLDMTQNGIRECRWIQSDSTTGHFENSIDMGSVSANMIITAANNFSLVDGTSTVFVTSVSKGVEFTRDVSPFTSLGDTYTLGTSSDNWRNLFVSRSLVIEDFYASGYAPATVTGHGQLFIRDNGSGKSNLRVKFNGTTSQSITVET